MAVQGSLKTEQRRFQAAYLALQPSAKRRRTTNKTNLHYRLVLLL
ncbi:hypothetical protein [Kingella oralis]